MRKNTTHPAVIEVQDLVCRDREDGNPPCGHCSRCRLIENVMHMNPEPLPMGLGIVRDLIDGFLHERARAKLGR